MLELSLVPKQGNAGGRFFPHAGYLGLGDVTVTGTFLTKLPALATPLAVKRILLTVKCYEARMSGPFGSDADIVLWEKTRQIWEPAGEAEYEDLADWEHPFKIIIPASAVDDAPSTQTTKEWKVVWRIEAIVDHKPIPYVGNRISKAYALNLFNHRMPILPPLSPPSAITVGHDATAAQVFINVPHGAFGPGDTLGVSFHAKPEDPTTILKSATVTLERRIEHFPQRERSPDDWFPPPAVPSPPSSSGSRGVSAFFRRSISPRPKYQKADSEVSSASGSSVGGIDHIIASTSKFTSFKVAEAACPEPVPGSGGMYWCQTSIPLPRRGGTWDLGETVKTKLVAISFDLKVKLTFKPAKGRSSSHHVSCPAMPVVLVGVSSPERIAAQAVIAAASPSGKPVAARRRHKSSRRGLYMQEGTVDIEDPVVSVRRKKPKSSDGSAPPALLTVARLNNADIKPILQQPNMPPAQSHSVQFIFPSPTVPQDTEEVPPAILPPINSLLSPTYTRLSPRSEVDAESMSIIQRFRQTGRRISTTTSEEEEVQPSRSRQKLLGGPGGADDQDAEFARPSLPSLDALGLGLPYVPDDPTRSRPRTAPAYIHSSFAASANMSSSASSSNPAASLSAGSTGAFGLRKVPPPLSGMLSSEMEMRQVENTRPATSFASTTTHAVRHHAGIAASPDLSTKPRLTRDLSADEKKAAASGKNGATSFAFGISRITNGI